MVDSSACDAVIDWFEKEGKDIQQEGVVGTDDGLKVQKHVKESTDIPLHIQQAYSIPVLVPVLDFLWECVQDYISNYNALQASSFSMVQAFNIQKYPPGGGYKSYHCERNKVGLNRALVWMIYLNDIKGENGGTDFLYYKHTERAEKGKALIWPPDFTHAHKSNVSPDQTKYIMTGWYDFIEPLG
jgi:hypothetical protein